MGYKRKKTMLPKYGTMNSVNKDNIGELLFLLDKETSCQIL